MDDTLRIAIDGEIDHHRATRLREDFSLMLRDPDVHHMVIDMRGVSMMDSSGIALMYGWYRQLEPRRGSIALTHVPPVVAKVMRIGGLHTVMSVKEEA